ncbi:MAG TPA: hypothetical protein VHY36_01805 [Steroidobacteraceae bacterium]|jgi:hypothetical protein|nr:hypothetical protein [Steroidobacteraceae bacterium]
MSTFERYLTLWVALCIAAGVGLGHLFPGVFQQIGAAEIAHVNLPVAVLIWLMIIPMLMKIRATERHAETYLRPRPRQTRYRDGGVRPYADEWAARLDQATAIDIAGVLLVAKW